MQVILPVINNNDKRMVLASGFHRTNWICVYDSELGRYEWFDADMLKAHSGNVLGELKTQGIGAVVTSDISFMALALFLENGFKVYKAASPYIEQNVALWAQRKLPLFGLQAAFKSTCNSGKCNTCSTMCKN